MANDTDVEGMIGVVGLERLLADNRRLNQQVTELQARMTEMKEESLSRQVHAFMSMAGQFIGTKPALPSEAVLRHHIKLFIEEPLEVFEAVFDLSGDTDWLEAKSVIVDMAGGLPLRVDMVALVDGLADTDYVSEAFRKALGVSGRPIANIVHRANMTKRDGPVVDGKKMKPPGWVPPEETIKAELRAQGWEG